jgi:RNA polymerase sigma factor (sigma-70 family)
MSRLQELLGRIRAGDGAAAEEFYRSYEPHVRSVIRARLRIPGARRISDSSDLCQIVFANFLVGSAVGRYDVDDSTAIKKLLATIAARRVVELTRRPELRHPAQPLKGPGEPGIEPIAPGSSPASQLALSELVQRAEGLLTDDEKRVAELRKRGLSWEEIGTKLGTKADAPRKLLDRAAKRVMLTLGLEEPIDE